jgi:CelD/BcsL family acetyltransferase involved in cellulose biosynthesis
LDVTADVRATTPAKAEPREASGFAISAEQLAGIETTWNWLARDCASPIEQFDWFQACLTGFVPRADLGVMTLVTAEGCSALAPLVRRRRQGILRLEFPGAQEMHAPADFVYRDPANVEPLVEILRRFNLPLWFYRVRADSPMVAAVRRAYRWPDVVVCRPHDAFPYIPLNDTWMEPDRHLHSHRRADVRRALIRAAEIGELTTEIVEPDLAQLSRLFGLALEIEARSWKGMAGTALVNDARRHTFYEHYTRAACHRGALRLAFLHLAAEPIAMQIAVVHGQSYWLMRTAFDSHYARFAPGILLTRETIAYAARQGLRTYEFMGGEERWTRAWSQAARPCISLKAYPCRPSGLAALGADSLGFLLRNWRERRLSGR